MRIRVVISGIIAGVISQFILKFMIFNIRLGEIVPGWLTVKPAVELPAWLDLALIGTACFVVFIFGWIAARWNWSRSWNASFLSGAGSGLIAGTLAFCFIGAFHAGIEGQSEILASLSRPVSESEGLALMLNSLTRTALQTYAFCGIYLLGGTLSGALGGLTSMLIDRNDVWGRPVSARDPRLFRLSAYYLTLTGVLNLVVTIAVTQVLDEVATKTVEENNMWDSLTLPPSLIFLTSTWAVYLLLHTPLALTWGWSLRDWIVERERRIISGLWVISTLGYTLYWIIKYALGNLDFIEIALMQLAVFLPLPFLAAVIGWNIKRTPASEWTPYRFGDHLGYLLTAAILGGAQMMAGVIAFSVSVTQITIVDIPHLMDMDEPLTATLAEQTHLLYNNQILLSLIVMGISVIFALIVSWFDGFVRWIFEKEKNKTVSSSESAH